MSIVTEVASAAAGLRAGFGGGVQGLRGRRVTAVDYWDIFPLGPEAPRWDYGQWHHAVMGVQLGSDAGPVTITWTNTFLPYGVEVFLEPIAHHLVQHDQGPTRIGPDRDDRWARLLGTPIRAARTWWDRLELGPATLGDGTAVAPARGVDLPTALRLDFDAGPVWFVAGIPQYPAMEDVFLPGDEIMVVFTAEKVRSIGFTDPTFSR